MRGYTVLAGESFEDISRVEFGSVGKAAAIIAANPGASNPPSQGTTLVIPRSEIPVVPANTKPGITTLVVDGSTFTGWTEIEFSRSIDSFGTFNFKSVWNPANEDLRQVFKPFGYQSVAVFEGGELLFNGTMINVTPSVSATQRTIAGTGYSLPGVINDCTPPISALPLERDAQDLQQIASELLAPFGLTLEFDGEPGPVFDREAIDPTVRIYDYLIDLAKQRNLIITDTAVGACKFHTETDTGSPVAIIDENDPAVIAISPQFNSQDYYSHISGQAATLFGAVDTEPGSAYTVVNPRLEGILRPFTFKPPDAQAGDIKTAVEAKAGRMFAGAVLYTISIPSWFDPSGNLWRPNTTIKIKSPNAMIYNSFEFLIRGVQYRRTAKLEIATLNLVLPGTFKGTIPEAMPWD